jgi:adenosylmethionine-8-amino-7-oxononanoate aminotransferase
MTEARNTDHVFHREVDRDYPMVDRASGIHVWDTAGRRYIDGAGGIFVVNVGHGIPEIERAIAQQIGRVGFAHTAFFTSEVEQEFANRLIEMAPAGFTKVWFCTSGSAANETALKLARHYHLISGHPQKTKIVSRWNSYHGGSIGALSMTGQPRRREPFTPYLLDFPKIEPPYCYRCPYGATPDSCGTACADALERTVNMVGADHIGAFIAEPVSGGPLGALVPPEDYFPKIREICDRQGLLMIVDEVITAAGRTGRAFGIEHWGVTPDIITCAKGIGGGYVPVGAVLVHERVYGAFERAGVSFRHGETFAGHAVISAAGAAVLRHIRDNDLIARADAMGKLLGEAMEGLRGLPMVGDVRGIGLLRGVELVRDKQTKAPFPRARNVSDQVAREAAQRGLLLVAGVGAADGIAGDTVSLAPPFIVTPADIVEIVAILSEAIRAVAAREAIA